MDKLGEQLIRDRADADAKYRRAAPMMRSDGKIAVTTAIDRDGLRWVTVWYWATECGWNPSDCCRSFPAPTR